MRLRKMCSKLLIGLCIDLYSETHWRIMLRLKWNEPLMNYQNIAMKNFLFILVSKFSFISSEIIWQIKQLKWKHVASLKLHIKRTTFKHSYHLLSARDTEMISCLFLVSHTQETFQIWMWAWKNFVRWFSRLKLLRNYVLKYLQDTTDTRRR